MPLIRIRKQLKKKPQQCSINNNGCRSVFEHICPRHTSIYYFFNFLFCFSFVRCAIVHGRMSVLASRSKCIHLYLRMRFACRFPFVMFKLFSFFVVIRSVLFQFALNNNKWLITWNWHEFHKVYWHWPTRNGFNCECDRKQRIIKQVQNRKPPAILIST